MHNALLERPRSTVGFGDLTCQSPQALNTIMHSVCFSEERGFESAFRKRDLRVQRRSISRRRVSPRFLFACLLENPNRHEKKSSGVGRARVDFHPVLHHHDQNFHPPPPQTLPSIQNLGSILDIHFLD